MARFREEYYEKRSYKARLARGRKSPQSAAEADRAASRAEYLKKPPSVRKAIHKAAQERLNGF